MQDRTRARFIAVSPQGIAYFWRKRDDLVRFPFVDPRADLESFAFHVLCEHVSFRQEGEFIQRFGTHARAAYALGMFDTFDKLNAHVCRHVKWRFASASLTLEQVMHISTQVLGPQRGPAPRQVARMDAMRAQALSAEAAAALPADLQLDPSQAAAVEYLTTPGARGLCIVTGGAGTGKSLVARTLVRELAETRGVCLMASTNEAGQLLSTFADTVHATCNIPINGYLFPPYDAGHPHSHTLATCSVFLIEEFSMLNKQVFEHAITRIGHAQLSSSDEALSNNLIILIGDEAQCPPICGPRCTTYAGVCLCHNIAADTSFKAAYQSNRCFRLAVNHRNPGFAHTLEAIRDQHARPLTQAWVDANINAPLVRISPVPLDARVLCSHHAEVDTYNAAIMDALAVDGAPRVDTSPRIRMQQNEMHAQHVECTLADLTPGEAAWVARLRDNKLPSAAIGTLVRFCATFDKRRKAVNGAMATIIDFNRTVEGRLTGIRVHLHRADTTLSVCRMQPSSRIVERRHIFAACFPLALGYASTTHSVQGASITEKVHIDLRDCFVPGMAYTALSRNTNVADITVGRPLTVHDLRVINLAAFYALQLELA